MKVYIVIIQLDSHDNEVIIESVWLNRVKACERLDLISHDYRGIKHMAWIEDKELEDYEREAELSKYE